MTESVNIGPTGETFLYDTMEREKHTAHESLTVDDGAVHIDGDKNETLHIKKTD